MKNKTLYLTQAAVIAAIYVLLVFITNQISSYLNYGLVQFRLSEALCILPVFTPAAIPGLFIGCLLSNLMSPLSVWDWIFGSGATLLAAIFTYMLRKYKWTAPIPAVAVNAIVVGIMLYCLGIVNEVTGVVGYTAIFVGMGSVALGQIVVCMGLGYPLMKILDKGNVIKPLK